MAGDFDEVAATALVARVAARDAAAWQQLAGMLFPVLERIAKRSHSMGPLKTSVDHCRNVATETLAKLSRHDYHALATFHPWCEKNPSKSLMDWLRIVTTNVIRTYVRKQLGERRAEEIDGEDTARKRALHTLATALPLDDQLSGVRPRVTDAQTARVILDYAEEHLADDQLAALRAWLEQADYVDVARAAGLPESDAKELARYGEKLVRAAVARLRRQFAIDTGVA